MFVGLTGSTGCGKTSALECFSSFGWKTLDADRICHELYDDPASGVPGAVRKRWGKKVFFPDGKINRGEIADIVFRNRKEILWLNSLLHPKVLEKARKEARESTNKDVIFAVPLLFEAGWKKEFGCVVSIWTDEEIQHERLKKRGWSEKEISRRCRSQLSPADKLGLADFAIINNGSLKSLFEQCKSLNKNIRKHYGKIC
ncbi:MAG TPA: dephospho-CoA kinase [Lentisphaeria bacterium]|nr:MAG: dephospho-CoA kinase [Lentisphaerae bacterium GWF2_49_21]HBC86122.1 dephospho-CoA kinase [Lentisphaeria bacterium]